MPAEIKVKSLEKAFQILECFSAQEPELGITEISKQLGLYKSNVFNILTTLETLGYIEKNNSNNKYTLGKRIIQLSHTAITYYGYKGEIRRCLKEISQEFEEIAYYGVPDGSHVIYIEGTYPDSSLNTNMIQGVVAPLTCTGIGKAILAFLPAERIEQVLAEPMQHCTDATITDPAEMRLHLEQVRRQGYSIDNMEHEYGVKCVGMPVFNRHRELVGAVSVTGPSLRFTDERIQKIVQVLRVKTRAIGESM